MRRLILCGALVISAAAVPATALAGLTGNQLLEMHRAQPLFSQSYLTGVYDGMVAAEGWRISKGETRTRQPAWGCPPAGVTNGQYVDVAIKALEAQPERRHAEASALATLAWQVAWPCPASGSTAAP